MTPPTATVAPRNRGWLHLLLLVLTLLSTFLTFASSPWVGVGTDVEIATEALLFAVALLGILGTHEMGHYLLARWHRVDTSLPFFIPLPFLGVGTLGAVIRIRQRIPDRNALVDIGAAGPLAGIAVALPVLVVGLRKAEVVAAPPLESQWPDPFSLLGVGQLVRDWLAGAPLELQGRMSYVFGDSLLLKGLQWLLLGPLPEGHDLLANPLIIAGWFGLLVTLLNLFPIGQLDGGHLTFAWFGRWARPLGKVMALGLLYLALFHSVSWVLWFLVATFLIRFDHPEVVDPEVPLTASRRLVCVLCFLAFVLCVMPVPLRMVIVP